MAPAHPIRMSLSPKILQPGRSKSGEHLNHAPAQKAVIVGERLFKAMA
jgi:hypothetical protein